ncbi:MAG: radical SAM family heme chaperone HemW [Candidatus Sericytochromatia bacterium]
MRNNPARSLYLHLPFCSVKCHYCDFVVRVLQQSAQIDRYLDHLELELAALSPLAGSLNTLYIGGGTPSLLSVSQVQRLARILSQRFDLNSLQECTLELNPESADPDALKAWQDLGVNRVSLGVQSFDPVLLASCGRSHGVAEITRAVTLLRELGLCNFSLDLIYGLPEQTLSSWQHSLTSALALEPQHISLYALEVHPRTHFGHQSLSLPDDDAAADMYDQAVLSLGEAGFWHYEVANWCRPDRASLHNRVYWRHQPFLAAGVGAHGWLLGRRYANPASLLDYYRACQSGAWAWEQAQGQSRSEEIEETVFLGLRLLHEGLDLEAFAARFGAPLAVFYPHVLPRLLREGWLEQGEQTLRLTPQAVAVSNGILAEFLDPHL